jgi:hypothetical protein
LNKEKNRNFQFQFIISVRVGTFNSNLIYGYVIGLSSRAPDNFLLQRVFTP